MPSQTLLQLRLGVLASLFVWLALGTFIVLDNAVATGEQELLDNSLAITDADIKNAAKDVTKILSQERIKRLVFVGLIAGSVGGVAFLYEKLSLPKVSGEEQNVIKDLKERANLEMMQRLCYQDTWRGMLHRSLQFFLISPVIIPIKWLADYISSGKIFMIWPTTSKFLSHYLEDLLGRAEKSMLWISFYKQTDIEFSELEAEEFTIILANLRKQFLLFLGALHLAKNDSLKMLRQQAAKSLTLFNKLALEQDRLPWAKKLAFFDQICTAWIKLKVVANAF